MKPINTFLFISIMTILLAACSAPAAPTLSAEDVRNTALAAAFTVVAETQAAIPSNTVAPPTETPTQTSLPTDTPVPLPTQTLLAFSSPEVTATAIQAGGNTDPCNAPLKSSPLGRSTKIKLENQTGAPIIASLYLNLTPIGECGFRGYNIGKGGAETITDLVQGCYNVSVLVNDPKKPTKSFGYGCINNSDQWTFVINRENVTLQGR